MNEIRPEAIFHLAAKTQVDDCELRPQEAMTANSLATRNLLNASRKFDPVFFYISTDYVFDGKKKTPCLVSDPLRPASAYGRSKAEGEKWVRTLVSRGVIIRTSWLYGADGYNFVDAILRAVSEQKELRVVDDQWGRPTFTRDLAGALSEMLKKVYFLPKISYGVYHFANSGQTSWFDFAKKILEFSGLSYPVKRMATEELKRPAPRPRYSVLDLSTIRRAWGIQPRDWETALKDFLREKGMLCERYQKAA
jgi:dTDP-4-dehydrorhamnose reductase